MVGKTVTSFAPTTSAEYIDPDLLQGEIRSRATDIWSLGARINRALSGEGLYGELPMEQPVLAIRAVVSGKARVWVKLDRPESELVQRCIAPVEKRLATAAEVAEGIAALR